MGEFGAIAENGIIRFERSVAGPLEAVWGHLTTPKRLARWLAGGDVQLRVGGYVELAFDLVEGKDRRNAGPNVSGVVSRCVPPRSLSYWWTDADTLSNVTIELTHRSPVVLLLLTHAGLPLSRVARTCASWHAHLDILEARLEHHQPPAFPDVFDRVIPHYERLCASSCAETG